MFVQGYDSGFSLDSNPDIPHLGAFLKKLDKYLVVMPAIKCFFGSSSPVHHMIPGARILYSVDVPCDDLYHFIPQEQRADLTPITQTPVVTCTLAITPTSLLPSVALQRVGFHSAKRNLSFRTTIIHFSGLNITPWRDYLAPSSSGLPLPVLPVDFANELLAKLCSYGTSADPATQRRSKLRNEIYCLIHSP